MVAAALKQTMGSENAKYLYECKAKEPKNERYALMKASLVDILQVSEAFDGNFKVKKISKERRDNEEHVIAPAKN